MIPSPSPIQLATFLSIISSAVLPQTQAQLAITQKSSLNASNPETGDRFGENIDISGNFAIVGAWSEDSSAQTINGDQTNNVALQAGAAYVYRRDEAGMWIQEAYLKASNAEAGDFFGWSVAISGNTAVVGAYVEDSNATGVGGNQTNNSTSSAGAAYVFERDETGTWTQTAYLKASNTRPNLWFGQSVDISGNYIVVGAHGEPSGVSNDQSNTSANRSGAAYVFHRDESGAWSQQAYLKASIPKASAHFGWSVAIDGPLIVVGAEFENNGAGAAYVFGRNGSGTWLQQARLQASNSGSQDRFGTAVDISGKTIVVGADREDGASTEINGTNSNGALNSGAAYIFSQITGPGATWEQQAYIKSSNTDEGDGFGESVSIDGNVVVIGARNEDSNASGIGGNQTDNSTSNSGATYVFSKDSQSIWRQVQYVKADTSDSGDGFGVSVAISGEIFMCGALSADSLSTGGGGNSVLGSGSVYSFFAEPAPEIAISTNAGVEAISGVTVVNFGVVPVGAEKSTTFTISNIGSLDLTDFQVSFTGTDATQFTVLTASDESLSAGESSELVIALRPQSSFAGTRAISASLQIASNDPDENPFIIILQGTILSTLSDSDGDGLNDAAEALMVNLGFNWESTQTELVSSLFQNANIAGLYTQDQIQTLNGTTMVIPKNKTTGTFMLSLNWKKSDNLSNFVDFPANSSQVSVNENGNIEFEFTTDKKTQFFRLELTK